MRSCPNYMQKHKLYHYSKLIRSCNFFFFKKKIAGLSYDTNETVLKDAFGQHGEIIEGDVHGEFLGDHYGSL